MPCVFALFGWVAEALKLVYLAGYEKGFTHASLFFLTLIVVALVARK
jgi:hypothetical protein